MRKHRSIITYIVLILLAIGIWTQLAGSPMLYTAIIVFGLVFVLYKFPPQRIRSVLLRTFGSKAGKSSRSNHRKRKFKVIQGNKKSGDQDPPPYH